MKNIPVTIVTGFLGSGKTTIIQNAVKKIWDKEKVAIIKNEIGDVGVDSLELSDPKLTITELANGCICCTLVGAMHEALEQIIEKYSPDRIFIEASGFAKPGQIVISLDLVNGLEIDGVIVVIDALNYKKLKEIEKSMAAKSEAEFIDLFVINKIDQVQENYIDEILDDLYDLNKDARIIESSDADIPAEVILGLHDSFISYELTAENNHEESFHDFESFNITNFSVPDCIFIQENFDQLPKNIYRAKGYFSDNNGKKYIVNFVAGKTNFKEIDKDLPGENKIVFIGKNISKYYEQVKKLFIF